MSRSRLAIWNYASVLLFTVVTTLGLLATRDVIRWVGDERFGAFRMLTDALGYLGLFELGLGGALSPLIARSLARDDPDDLTRTMAVGLRAFLYGTIGLVAFAVLLWPLIDWLVGVPAEARIDLAVGWGVAVVSLLPLVLAPFRSLADAGQRGYRINLALTVQSVAIFGLSIFFARAGWGIRGQVIAATIGALPLALFLATDGLKRFPGLWRRAWATPVDPAVRAELAAIAAPSFLIAFGGRIGLLSDSLVAGKILGAETAGRLYLTTRLAVMAQGQLQAVGTASWAGLAELHAQGKREQFNTRLVELTGVVGLMATAGIAPIAAYNHHFIRMWVGSERDQGEGAILLALANAFLLGLFSLWTWCFGGTGRAATMAPATLAASLLNLAASVVFTYAFGVVGPLLGTMFSFVAVTGWYVPWRLRREFGTSVAGLLRAAAVPLAWGVPYGLLLRWIARSHRPWGWIGLGLEMSTAALAFLVFGALVILSPADRLVWTRRLRSALPGRAA